MSVDRHNGGQVAKKEDKRYVKYLYKKETEDRQTDIYRD